MIEYKMYLHLSELTQRCLILISSLSPQLILILSSVKVTGKSHRLAHTHMGPLCDVHALACCNVSRTLNAPQLPRKPVRRYFTHAVPPTQHLCRRLLAVLGHERGPEERFHLGG